MAKLKRSDIKRDQAHVVDPFKHLAYGLVTDPDEIWEEEPVSIVEFIESKQFLNQKFIPPSENRSASGCRPKIMEIAVALADEKVREAILLLGKGSGKDYISSILHLYGIYRCQCMYSPQVYYGLAPGSPIYFINVARNETQAKNVFFKSFLGHLANCSWFENMYIEPGGQHVEFRKSIFALSGNSQAFSWLGYNTIQWVGDEIAFFLESGNKDEDTAASKAEECWEAAFGSCHTRFKMHYKMIGITTPRYDDDFVMHKFQELKRRMDTDGDGYVAQAATWDVHPEHTIEDYKYSLERDYRRTMRDYGAQPMGVIETFWGDPDFIDSNVCEICRQCPVYQSRDENVDNYVCREYEDCMANPYRGNGHIADWFRPVEGGEYYMHFDLSKNKDKTGWSMTHVTDWIDVKLDPFEIQQGKEERDSKSLLTEDDMYEERPLVKIDMIGYIDPKDRRDDRMLKNKEIYYAAILKYIVCELLNRGFNIVKATADSYQSHQFKQTLEDLGIETELLSLDRTDEVPVAAKNAFTENRVEYPYDRVFARESRHLKYIRGNKVDHPTGYGKDVIDGAFGAVYNADTAETGHAAFEMATCGEDDD